MIDIHAHLYDAKFDGLLPGILRQAQINGVEKIVCVGSGISTSKQALALAQKHNNVFCVVGVHPENAKHFDADAEEFLKHACQSPKTIAIGEIGLDYHYEGYDKNLQKKVFLQQLALAFNLKMPVQIHCRDAFFDLVDILEQNKHLLAYGGIVHCFSESATHLNRLKKLGLGISIGGVVTFKNGQNVQEIAAHAPLDMITLETDCPYLAPHPNRGQTNQPAFVAFTAQKIALIKGISFDDLDKITTQNALRFFPKLNA